MNQNIRFLILLHTLFLFINNVIKGDLAEQPLV